jgi:hypothetical protein
MDTKLLKFIPSILIAAAVIGCTGGGGGSGGGQTAGIERLGVSSGTVTGFGSIFVNGVEFETDSAEFDIDEDASGSSQDDLDVGDTVIVTFDPAAAGSVAQTVFSDEAVEGPIDSINAPDCGLVVAGQCVLIDAGTSFDDSIPTASIDGLNPGDFVEVSGLFDSSDGVSLDRIRATRIELKPSVPGEVEVHGEVSALNAGNMTFMINDLEVDFGAVPAIIDDDFPGMTFANGDFVEVKGTNFDGGGALLATKIEPDGPGLAAGGIDLDAFDEVQVELEGFITRYVSAADFDVAGFPVTTNGMTVFEGGTAADLGLNVKVEVEGNVIDDVLVADKVDIRRANKLRVTALVDDVDPDPMNPQIGTLVVLGITVRVDALTRVEDKSDADIESFDLSLLNVNDYVEVRGGADPAGGADIVAGLLEREDPPNVPGEDTEIRGFVDTVAQPSFTIAGVTIETSGGTVFRDAAGTSIGGTAFFNALQPGDLVDADGFESSQTTLMAEEVEFEN